MAKAEKKKVSLEAGLWAACNKLRGSVSATDYVNVVLGLLFLRFAYHKFNDQRDKLLADEDKKDFVDNPKFYSKDNVFYLEEHDCWNYIIDNSKRNTIFTIIDDAFKNIEKNNISLKGALPIGFSPWCLCIKRKGAVTLKIRYGPISFGGGTMVIPIIQRMDVITLENIMFPVEIRQTKTALGVPLNAEGIVVIKVKNDQNSILAAVQQFNSAREEQTLTTIRTQASEICKGKLREIVSSMSVEDIYNDRESFSAKVQQVAGTELGEMGLELKSFTINDITDDEGYIEALGKEQIAKVKSSAAIAEAEAAKEREIRTAEALREQQIKTAEARKLGKQAELGAEAQIAEAEKDKELKILGYKRDQETQKAVADAAYQIQKNITSKEVKNTEMDALVLEKQRDKEVAEAQVQVLIITEEKNIELAKKRAERKEAELLETVVKPAEAARQKQQLDAEGKKFEQVKAAEAEAEKLRLEGEAQASVIEAMGNAEAGAIRAKGLAEAAALAEKAEALAKMNEAGKLQMVIDRKD